MRPEVWTLFLLSAFTGCRSTPPVQVTETGWIISCEDGDPGVAKGLPYLTFTTKWNDFDLDNDLTMFVFYSHGVPPCSTWPKSSKYEMTVVQHVDWRGRPNGTWDLKSMKAIRFLSDPQGDAP
jgi:hypothetical protein